MNQKPSNKRNYLRSAVLVIGFVAFLLLTFAASAKYIGNLWEEDVSNVDVDYFPVVVITPENAEIVNIKSLKQFTEKLQNYSFLVPEGKEELVNKQLENSQKERGGKGRPEIRRTRISENKQLIELEIFGDGLFLARYEADDKQVKPLTFKLTGPLFGCFPGIATIVIGLIGYFLLRSTLGFLKKKQIAE